MTAIATSIRRDARPPARAAPVAPPRASSKWLTGFVLFQILCQLALLVPALGALRVFVRSGAFAGSLALAIFVRGTGRRHPAAVPAIVAVLIVVASFFHPTTNGVVSGLVDAAFYIAVLAPLVWVARLNVDAATLRRVLLMIWAFHFASAGLGALQVYYPGEFQPAVSTVLSEDYVSSLKLTLANGDTVLRPMGLTDTPGGAATAGFYAVLLGVGFLLSRPPWWFRGILAASVGLGMFVLYLSQVRSLLVMLVVCLLSVGALVAYQRGVVRLAMQASVLAAIAVGAFVLAIGVGGASVTDRLSTLIEEDPGAVYYKNRGIFLEQTLTELLPAYPLGAGLGRWGMVNRYFGEAFDARRGPIYVEIQWTGWLLDGGVPLVLAYAVAIGAALWFALKVATGRVAAASEGLRLWGIVVVAYYLGALALTFNYPLFMGSMGVEFWLLNAALSCAAQAEGSADAGASVVNHFVEHLPKRR